MKKVWGEKAVRVKNYAVLMLLLVALTLAGCGKNTAPEKESRRHRQQESPTQEEKPTLGEGVSGSEKKGEEIEKDALVDYTFEEIAALNGIKEDDLNVLFNYDGSLLFLGNKYGDEIVKDEYDAQQSLAHIYTVAGLDGVRINYNRTDVSPATGNVVYTFYQVSDTYLDGELVTARYYNSLIKVITDKAGHLLGVSSDIYHDEDIQEVDADTVITRSEAVDYVKWLVNDRTKRVYGDEAMYVFWDDEATAGRVNEGKVTPAWVIHADANLEESGGKPYVVYVIALNYGLTINDAGDYENCPAVMAKFYADTRDSQEYMGTYTSTFFFDGMQDAGEYTYELDMSWVKRYYPGYRGEMTRSVTVPVMYSEREGLYYLGSLDRKITLSNYYDFAVLESTNAYVTTDPSRSDNWHFQLEQAPDGSTGTYFDNPNYVLSSFEVMCDVWNFFYDRYGMDSVDNTGLPTILLAYGLDDMNYPDTEDGFFENACNLGQFKDWQAMASSPCLPACLDHTVMSHEYTHGINAQLTKSQYFNGQGAVMEGYADIIGAFISMIYGCPESVGENAWRISPVYCDEMRNMSDPTLHACPKYLHGNYYVNPVEPSVSEMADCGGVHTNSGVLGYLAYCLVQGMDGDSRDVLTLEECLDMWFDTLYYTNYQTDYYDIAYYLQFSARSMGLSLAKLSYVERVLEAFGMYAELGEQRQCTLTEDSLTYNVYVEYDESLFEDLAYSFPMAMLFETTDEEYCVMGGLYSGENAYSINPDKKLLNTYVVIGNAESGKTLDFVELDERYVTPYNINLYYEFAPLVVGNYYTTLEGWEIVGGGHGSADIIDEFYEDGSAQLYIEEDGNYFLVLRDNEDSDQEAYYRILHIFASDEEFINENF